MREEFQPMDLSQKYARLFTDWPDLEDENIDDAHDVLAKEKKLEDLREEAIRDILKKCKQQGIVELLTFIEDPVSLAALLFKYHVSKGTQTFKLEEYLLSCLKSDIDTFKLKRHISHLFGWTKGNPNALNASKTIQIIEKVRKELVKLDGDKELDKKNVLLLHAIRIDETKGRKYIDDLPDELKRQYFSDYRLPRFMECRPNKDSNKHPPESTWLVDRYIEYKRPRLGWYSFMTSSHIPFEKQIDLLNAMFVQGQDEGPEQDPLPRSYDIEQILEKGPEKALHQKLSDEQEEKLLHIEFKFFKFLEHQFKRQGGIFTMRQIGKTPAFLIQLAKHVYKTDDGDKPVNQNETDVDASQKNNLKFYANAADILFYLNPFSKHLPWGRAQGMNDEEKFLDWFKQSMQLAKDAKMVVATDIILGRGLSKEVESDKDLRPLPAACKVLEQFASEDMLEEFRVGRFNSRGVVSNGVDDRGYSTPDLADHYKDIAQKLQNDYPKVASVMRQLEQRYRREAEIDQQIEDERDLNWR
jgi:hypothetical protein